MPSLSVSSALPEQRPSLPHPFSSNLGYICRPVCSIQLEDDPASEEPEAPPIGLRRARLQSTPSSCYSEWDSSLWNTWSSVTDDNMASTRTSLISSVDSCYTTDSTNFARLLAVAAETMSAASLSGKQRRNLSLWYFWILVITPSFWTKRISVLSLFSWRKAVLHSDKPNTFSVCSCTTFPLLSCPSVNLLCSNVVCM